MFDNCRSANTVRLTLILLYGFSALVSAQGHMQTLQKVEEEVSKVRTKNVQTQGSSCGSDTWGHRLLASCIFARKKEPVAIPHFECEGRCLKLRCWNKNDMRMPPAPRSGKLHPKWNLGPSRGEGAPEANRWDIGHLAFSSFSHRIEAGKPRLQGQEQQVQGGWQNMVATILTILLQPDWFQLCPLLGLFFGGLNRTRIPMFIDDWRWLEYYFVILPRSQFLWVWWAPLQHLQGTASICI